MAPKRGASTQLGLCASSDRKDVIHWLRSFVRLPYQTVTELEDLWNKNKELVDGEFILEADVETLEAIGVASNVAQQIVNAVQAQRQGLPHTQALAPTTQQVANGTEQEQQEQVPQRRRGRSRCLTPLPDLNGTQQAGAGNQRVLGTQIKPDPEAWEQQMRQEAVIAAQVASAPRRSRRQRSQPPEEPQQAAQVKPEPQDVEMGEQEEEEEEEAEEEDAEGDEEGEEEEEEDAPVRRSTRSMRGTRSTRSGSVPVKQEAGGPAVEEQSVALTGTGGRTTRRSSRAAAAAAAGASPADQQQQQEEVAGGSVPRMSTRRRQQGDQQGPRQMRLTTMRERQRRHDEAAAQSDDEELEEAAQQQAQQTQQTQQQQQQQQQQQEDGMQADAEEGEGQEEPPVMEDLGPPAPKGYYEKDWRRRARWHLHEIFSSMSVEALRELVQAQEEWPELAQNCLRQKKRIDGETEWVDISKAKTIATKLVNFLMTGHPEGHETEEGGLSKEAIKELLREHCDEAVRAFVEDKLKPRYQNLPRTDNYHKLLWHLCLHPLGFTDAAGNRDVQEFPVLLGKRTLQYVKIEGSADLEPAASGFVPWRAIWAALNSGRLTLAGQDDEDRMLLVWLTQLNDLSTHQKCKVSTRLSRQPDNRKLTIYLYQLFDKKSPSSSVIAGTWKRDSLEDPGTEELVAVDLVFLLGELDGLAGTPFAEQMGRLADGFAETQQQAEGRGLAGELDLGTPMNLKQFDKVMALVEDIDRGEPPGFKRECDDAFQLELRPYQRRALAHVLREERAAPTAANPGGSARHMWVKLPLPENPDVHCFVSPILHQIRTSISKIEAEQMVGASGGAGWIALQMGMGKTACAVGAIQMNPPPADWRKNRAWQSLRREDMLASIENNMPHGGTLIVMPPTLIDQWEDEVRKTTDEELSILKWTENTKGHPRVEDCRDIAEYDIVMTTFQLASNLHTLSHLRWWRIVVDEPQLGAGGFLQDKEHVWLSNHRWLLTGTPINHAVDTMTPSLEFLKLGTFDALYTYFPPVATHVLKTFMVRYTKAGVLDGEQNLALPPITENLVECELNDDDDYYYRSLQREQKQSFAQVIARLRIEMDMLGADRDPNWEYQGRQRFKPTTMIKLRGMLNPLRQAASSALKQPTGVSHYDDARGVYVNEKHWYQSKAEAVIEVLRDKDPEEKVLIFSEFPNTLRAIKAMLPEVGLQSRNLIGSTSAAARGKAIRAFQTDPPTKVFLLTYRAGGAGITLTAGTHIVLCEPTLNPSFERQAIGRSHRMGQDKALTVTRFLMKGTVEEKIKAFVERQVEQEGEPQEVPESTAMEANLASHDESNKLTVEDLRDMIHDSVLDGGEGEEED
ncbi:hypothetical protein ABPG77_007299 [Micractinium sp. CCAP 211/92]